MVQKHLRAKSVDWNYQKLFITNQLNQIKMKFKDVLKNVTEGLSCYYSAVESDHDSDRFKNNFYKLETCEDMQELDKIMRALGFGPEDGEDLYWWIVLFIVDTPDDEKMEEEKFPCGTCHKMITANEFIGGVCKSCDEAGFWIDPVGGVHHGNEEDPAAMYE
jgi:hypothetical protein